jgi:poly-gamma-glutamate synthesis protein (capsule biosynthesis protein)
MIQSARQAGATLIINHHPHVVGGFHWDGTTLVARTMGNFLFDQTVWPTFESYLLAVHLRNGKVIHAYTEPLLVEGYLPKGITGDRADFVARGAAGREAGPFVLENGAMELDVDDRSLHRETKVSVSADGKTGTIFRLDRGWWVTGFSGKGDFRLGRDLLWVGDFEDEVGDGKNQGGALWNFSGFDKFLGAQYAYDGNLGARIQRRNYNKSHVVLTPIHRILVESGSQLSIVGMVRSSVKNPASLLLSWYAYLKGASQAKQTKLLTVSADARWTPFRLDVTVPSHTIALGLYLRLQPPIGGIATADFDNIRILEWAAKNTSFSPLYNYVWVRGTGEFRVQKDFFLGDEQGSDRENFSPLKALDRSKE